MKKNKLKVLIIDDNYSILEYLKTVFRKYNFDIRTSLNGYDGLRDVADFKPDIIFLDLMMPNIDGIQLLQLKKVLNDIKNIPVIVISANAGRNNVIAAIEAGADRVLAKPINIKQLKAAVNEVLGGSFFEITNEDLTIDNGTVEFSDNEFLIKFFEFKDEILNSIRKRDPKGVKEIIFRLLEYNKGKDMRLNSLLVELRDRELKKPSDWMFAEMKIKEIEQNFKKVIKNL